jgi:hypothetical protein
MTVSLFNDRRAGLVDVVNPAETRRASLARPDKPGQATRAYMARTSRVHSDVQAGHAAVVNPVPAVVQQRVQQGYQGQTILPQAGRGGRMLARLTGRR